MYEKPLPEEDTHTLRAGIVKVDNNGIIQYYTAKDFHNQRVWVLYNDDMNNIEDMKNRRLGREEIENSKVDMPRYIQQQFGISESFLANLNIQLLPGEGNKVWFTGEGRKILGSLSFDFNKGEGMFQSSKIGELQMPNIIGTPDELNATIKNQLHLLGTYNTAWEKWEDRRTSDDIKTQLNESLAFMALHANRLISGDWTSLTNRERLQVGTNIFTKESTVTASGISINETGSIIIS